MPFPDEMVRNPDGSVAFAQGVSDFNLDVYQKTSYDAIFNPSAPLTGPQVGPQLPAYAPGTPGLSTPAAAEPFQPPVHEDPAHPGSSFENPALPPGWALPDNTSAGMDLSQAPTPDVGSGGGATPPTNVDLAIAAGAELRLAQGDNKCSVCNSDLNQDGSCDACTSLAGANEAEFMLLLEKGGHNLKCPKCGTVNKASSDKCKSCGHALGEARKAKFANMSQHGASVFQPELMMAGVKEHNGLIYKVVCKTGTLALSPGPGQMDIEKPLELTHDLFGAVKTAWDDGAVRYVTLPETHANGTFENKGYVKDLQILDQTGVKELLGDEAHAIIQEDEPDTQYLAAGLYITDGEAKKSVLEGSVADMSVGIKFNQRPNKRTGKLYPAVLNHIAFTNEPWMDGLIPFNPAIMASQKPSDAPYDHEAEHTDENAVSWDGVFMTAEVSETPSSSGPAAEVVDTPSDDNALAGLAQKLGLSVEEARDWGLEVEDGGQTGQDTLAAAQPSASLPSTMPQETPQQKAAREARERAAAAAAGGGELAQILADQTARLEAAEARATAAEQTAAAAQGTLLAQGKHIHLAQVRERITELQRDPGRRLPPSVLLAAKIVMEGDYADSRDDDGALVLSQKVPDTENEGQFKDQEFKLSTPTEIVEFMLASMPRSEQPDIPVVGDLQDLHAAQADVKANADKQAKEDMDSLEKELHPHRFHPETGEKLKKFGGTAEG